jgi:hypothetical protein
MKNPHFIILSLLSLLIIACEGEPIDPNRVGNSIKVTANIEGVKTRLTGSTWDKGDGIGIYMVKSGVPLNKSALVKNAHYEYDESGIFTPKNKSQTIYLPLNGSDVDFIGYYPYREGLTDFNYSIDLTVQSNQAELDFMYADNVRAKNMSNNNVDMIFSHQLSKIVLEITHYRNIDLSDISVILTNVPTKASINLENGVLTSSPETEDIALAVNKEGSVAEAILLPGSDLSQSTLWFVIGEKEQVFKSTLPSNITSKPLASSTLHKMNATLHIGDEKRAEISSGSIIPWITPPSETINVEQTLTDPPSIKGTISDPYTVAQAIDSQGKNDVWVKGYIVGAFNSSINKFVTDSTGSVRTNIALADDVNETVISKMIPVNFTTSAMKKALNIVDNPTNLTKYVYIRGDFATYYSVAGVRNVDAYKFID